MSYLIMDIDVSDETQAKLVALGFCLLSNQALAQKLLGWRGWQTFDRSRTLLVFVGNGGGKVKELLPDEWRSQWLWKTNAFAKRFWQPGAHPYAIAHCFARGVYIGITDVVVIDDVVSSGITAKRVKEVNVSWVPAAKWHLAVLIAQRAASTRGYASTFVVAEVGTPQSKVPLNSLSTLIAEPEIAQVYAERNCGGRTKEFLDLISKLRICLNPPPFWI